LRSPLLRFAFARCSRRLLFISFCFRLFPICGSSDAWHFHQKTGLRGADCRGSMRA
jgi:hypothetical protein